MSPRSAARRATVGAVLLGIALPLLSAVPAAAEPPRPEPAAPYFGPALLYPGDTPAAYVERVGVTPAMYTLPVPYPLDGGATSQLDQFSALVAEQGAVLLLDVQPAVRLGRLTRDDAAALARRLELVHDRLDIRVLVRFAPEMNGSWETWGQQPGAYVRSFRALASEVRSVDATEAWAAMVWAPVYGSGYPFRDPDRTQGALDDVLAEDRRRLDTDGDRRLDLGDDPYLPYYPGDEWVDWVGLSMYRLGQSQGARRNGVPPTDEFRRRLQETWGYPDEGGGAPFYERFAEARDRPMLVETAAFYNSAYRGPDQLSVKRAWWRQVFRALADYPLIAGISWLEVARAEPEALQDDPVDWRVSHRPRIARAFAAALEGSSVTLAPVTDPVPIADEPTEPAAPAPDGSSSEADDDAAAHAVAARPGVPLEEGDARWWALGSTVLLAVGLLLARMVPGWRAPARAARDGRLDVLRGGLVLAVAGAFVAVLGTGAVRSVDRWAFEATTGLLLLVSGAAHGVRAQEVAGRLGAWASGVTRTRRARSVLVAGIALAVLALLLENLPGVTSPLGEYEYPRALLDYPPPSYAVWDLLSLSAAPWLVSTLVLFVVLALLAPLFLALLRRGWWWAALAVSWVLYAVGVATDADVLPLGVEPSLPILVWQLPFVHGLALGHGREAVTRLLSRGWPGAVLAVVAAAYAGLLVADARPGGVTPMPAVVGLSAASLLGVLTGAWRPVRGLLGWLLEPVGRAPLVAVAVTLVAVNLLAAYPPGTASARWGAVAGTLAVVWLLSSGATRLSGTRART